MYQALLVLFRIPLYGFLKTPRSGQIEETVDMPPEPADALPKWANT